MGPGVRQRGSVILAQRARVHLVYRLTGRIIETLAASRPGSVRRVVPRTLLFAAADVGSAAVLRRSKKFHVVPRLAADADTAGRDGLALDLMETCRRP